MAMEKCENMMSKRFWWVLAGLLACAAAAPAQEPPLVDIPASALTGALAPQYVEMVRKRLEYRREQLAAAATPKAVIEAREGILADYALYDAAGHQYQYAFAQHAREVLIPVLEQPMPPEDKLAALKQVNIAVALSRMPQVTIQPALDAMVKHPNGAVRFLGWEGYHSARTILFAQGRNETQQFFASLQTAAAQEQSPPVMGAIFDAANISSFADARVSAATIQEAQRQAFAILQANWRRWCERVLAGDEEMTRAMTKGVSAAATLAGGLEAPGKTAAVQMVIDAMRCASLAYDEAGAEGRVAEENDALLQMCEATLSSSEGALFPVTNKRADYVTKALGEKETEVRRVNVPTAVLKWIDDLKEFGVVKADFVPPTPTTATAPATTETAEAETAPSETAPSTTQPADTATQPTTQPAP